MPSLGLGIFFWPNPLFHSHNFLYNALMETHQKPKEYGQRDLVRRMLPWVKPYRSTFMGALLLLFITSGAKMAGPVILQRAVDDYIVPGHFQGLVLLLAAYIVLLMIGFVANYFEIIQLEIVGLRVITDLKKRSFAHLLQLSLPFYDQHNTGKLVSRIENDANAMKVLFSTVITNLLGNLLVVIGMFCIMAWQYDISLALYVVGLCPVVLGAAIGFNKWMEPLLIHIRKLVSEVNGQVTEMIQGIGTIQVFGQEARFVQQIMAQSKAKYAQEFKMSIAFNSFFNSLFFVRTLGLVLILWFGGQQVMSGQMTIGSLVLFMSFMQSFFVPIMFLSSQFNEFQKGIAAAQRIFALLDTQSMIVDTPHPQPFPKGPIEITFDKVWFKYTDEWVLKDLSFTCPPGEHWAIVGPTGSGKTTLISLLLRFYEPQKGRIFINGINIQDFSLETLREGLGLVLQDLVFFPGTLYRNLTMGKAVQENQMIHVMQEIGAYELVKQLPKGFETEISEGAQNFSAGEKQLLSFTRALLKNPQILILDEATANIDPKTEKVLQQAMNTLLEGRTAIIIAHRLNTIEKADRILVIQYGRLVESGNHQELMKHNGVYAQLQRLQVLS